MIYFVKTKENKKERSFNLDTSEKIIDKLKYIGLDLGNIPEFIKDFKELDYRPSKYNDEHLYKVYKYIDISNILNVRQDNRK